MQIADAIKARLGEISQAVMGLVDDQSLSLTEKNKTMKPLVEEKRLLEQTLAELERIRSTDYSGSCNPR